MEGPCGPATRNGYAPAVEAHHTFINQRDILQRAASAHEVAKATAERYAANHTSYGVEFAPPGEVVIRVKPGNRRFRWDSVTWRRKLVAAVDNVIEEIDRTHRETMQVPPGYDPARIARLAIESVHAEADVRYTNWTFVCNVHGIGMDGGEYYGALNEAYDEVGAMLVDIGAAKNATEARQMLEQAKVENQRERDAYILEQREWVRSKYASNVWSGIQAACADMKTSQDEPLHDAFGGSTAPSTPQQPPEWLSAPDRDGARDKIIEDVLDILRLDYERTHAAWGLGGDVSMGIVSHNSTCHKAIAGYYAHAAESFVWARVCGSIEEAHMLLDAEIERRRAAIEKSRRRSLAWGSW